LIDNDYLKSQSEILSRGSGLACLPDRQGVRGLGCIGLLIGGDTKDFRLDKGIISEVINQLKAVSGRFGLDILATTSRRTSAEIEGLLKSELGSFAGCKLLVIANEKNIPEAIGGILGLSRIVIVSAESISMISEAASSGRYIIVFESRVNPRHREFLDNLSKAGHIYLIPAGGIGALCERLNRDNPESLVLQDKVVVERALERVL
jgi:mitochondrial fission protein ELM1